MITSVSPEADTAGRRCCLLTLSGPMPNVTGMALLLPGWDRYSVWGWDPTGGHLSARLWRNNDRPDMPPAIRVEPSL
jgi:hypothetical protein